MNRLLLLLALLFTFILTLLGFDVFHADDPHLFGWLGLALGCGSYGTFGLTTPDLAFQPGDRRK